MELKRCERCGIFFVSDTNVCEGCIKKDSADLLKLRGILEEKQDIRDKDELAMYAGISIKNIDRYLNMEEFNNIEFNNKLENIEDTENKITELL